MYLVGEGGLKVSVAGESDIATVLRQSLYHKLYTHTQSVTRLWGQQVAWRSQLYHKLYTHTQSVTGLWGQQVAWRSQLYHKLYTHTQSVTRLWG